MWREKETGRHFHNCICDHVCDTKPVPYPYISTNHKINHMTVFGLFCITGTNDNHKSKEI